MASTPKPPVNAPVVAGKPVSGWKTATDESAAAKSSRVYRPNTPPAGPSSEGADEGVRIRYKTPPATPAEGSTRYAESLSMEGRLGGQFAGGHGIDNEEFGGGRPGQIK